MKISKMIYEVENVLEVLESDYFEIEWKNKKMVDVLRYEEAKKLRNKIDEAFYTDDVEYDVKDIEYVEDLLSSLDMLLRKYENKIV